MSFYLDANIIVALLIPDALADRTEALMSRRGAALIVSDFAATEFAAVIARKVRIGALSREQAQSTFGEFDAWVDGKCQRAEVANVDCTSAEAMLRRLDLPLMAPDAIHIAIAQRVGATLVTFDQRMAAAARALGRAVAGA
jgi:hypothetical protein